MGSKDRFNRMEAAMVRLAEDGTDPVLAVRHEGRVVEFRVNRMTNHLEGGSVHPRVILEDMATQFVEGYPGYRIDRALAEIW